jgi:hypothetical protein
MAQWKQPKDQKLATSAKSWALQYTVGLKPLKSHAIPMPKPAGGSREGRILRQTAEKIEGYRMVTTPEFRENCIIGKNASIEYLPHPSVLADETSAKAWMQKFSRASERNIAHVPEQALCFCDGMPLLVSFQDSHM